MAKKFLMIFLAVAFILGVITLVLFSKKKDLMTSISLPLLRSTPTPLATPSATITNTPQLSELENDLLAIEKDLEKMKKEDTRLVPPTFIFDLGLK